MPPRSDVSQRFSHRQIIFQSEHMFMQDAHSYQSDAEPQDPEPAPNTGRLLCHVGNYLRFHVEAASASMVATGKPGWSHAWHLAVWCVCLLIASCVRVDSR